MEIHVDTVSQNTKFTYGPLHGNAGEIRLIELLPGDEWSPIECILRIVALPINDTGKTGAEPVYSAVSYTWGSIDRRRSVKLDGKSMSVRENLWMALFYLRSRTDSLTLWIDALCINQSDVIERNDQVGRMGEIYGRAQQVILWLGKPTDESYHALNFFRSLTTSEQKEAEQIGSGDQKSKILQSSFDVCQRPYWRRLWVIQELVRATNIIIRCGTELISWDDLCSGLDFIKLHTIEEVLPQNALQRVLDLASLRKLYHQSGCELIQLLACSATAECLDPRDKIYGLLGLANDCKDEGFVADYNKSIWELYYDVMIFYSHQCMEQEASQGGVDWRIPGLVQFSGMLQQLLFQDIILGNSKPYTGSPKSELSEVFHFTGFFAGSVVAIGPAVSDLNDSENLRHGLLAAWYNIVRPKAVVERGQAYEMIRLALDLSIETAAGFSKRINPIRKSSSQAVIGPRARESITRTNSHDTVFPPPRNRCFPTIDSVKSSQLKGPRLAFVQYKSASWIGVVPFMVQPGDLVASFLGCETAAILRPSSGGHCGIFGTGMLVPCTADALSSLENDIDVLHTGQEEVAFSVDIKTLHKLSR
ncbi:hypothetical protein BP5796_02191 [Coleophoma crateriformis]|uniref:Heterokaryon incompatibility domain-containing protein n=1 Tax=Coleophoma crateriformis TaxID=565419 RepID=A0A3D8SXJ1_9HELO|nr:hypothetical protein BP5796_02191 [Coleophoma crateriformis]